MDNKILIMQNISKSFAGVKVLKNVNFNIYHSEVMALLGENGAGKSTLMKILTGVYKKDDGKIFFNNVEIEFKKTRETYEKGIYIIMQELNLIPYLTVGENIFLGREPINKWGFINWTEIHEKTNDILKELNVNFHAEVIVGDLSIGNQKMVEIARAIFFDAKIIIMDEVTDAITDKEKEVLFNIIEKLKNSGKSIVYITHKLDEIFKICDRVTVLRDGMFVREQKVADITTLSLIKDMVGSNFSDYSAWVDIPRKKKVLDVKNLTNKYIKDISFDVYESEILGIAGLIGSGRTELAKTIYGVYPLNEGSIFLNNEKILINSCRDALQNGIVYISEDRKTEGLIIDMSIRENITLSILEKLINKFGLIKHNEEIELTKSLIKRLKIKTFSPEQKVENLSGGNQQKISISKGLVCNPKLFILDEPTRGVDVGARREIYNIINELKSHELAIIIISSDIEEILSICDRVMVMFNGKISGMLTRANLDKEKILKMAFNA